MVTFSVGNVRAGGKASTSRRGKRWKEEGTIEGRWPAYLEKIKKHETERGKRKARVGE